MKGEAILTILRNTVEDTRTYNTKNKYFEIGKTNNILSKK